MLEVRSHKTFPIRMPSVNEKGKLNAVKLLGAGLAGEIRTPTHADERRCTVARCEMRVGRVSAIAGERDRGCTRAKSVLRDPKQSSVHL